MKNMVAKHQGELIGSSPLLRIKSLSELTKSDIFIKCEHFNPGGSIKDRAALNMVLAAIKDGRLKTGMTIVEGTAGNTGIGLALVGRALGFEVLVVMPKGQTPEKERMISLHGAKLKLVDPCPFANPNHFYHTAKRIAEESPDQYWWANQFENTDNAMAHYKHTGPEIYEQMDGKIDAFLSVAGTGGTIGGCSKYLKEKDSKIKTILVDPGGSGLKSYFETGEFKSQGGSFTEGIGIMRLTANFALANVDEALSFPDDDIVTISRHLQQEDGIVLGSSSALNVTAAFYMALKLGPGKRIVSFSCDLGERSFSKLYNRTFLEGKGINIERDINGLVNAWDLSIP